ncbi:MAG: tRNA uridine-5-carboxymethylaminomethyl(34) synthesis enzyme MnmG [gamma proteobacterium endosymbiont of Trioza apicalis]
MYNNKYFDVIIIGGGHAGIEATASSARMGCKTLLLTHNINTIGELSCNPAIGGIGKSQLVKEIDALDGLMAKAVDKSGIQFKILNKSKGPAVRSTRVQVDRLMYRKNIIKLLKKQNNIIILQKEVKNLIIKNNIVYGVLIKNNIKYYSYTVIITTGTFLNGKIYIGMKSHLSGRIKDYSSYILANFLKKFPFKINKLKTGTPPRININTINFKKLEFQISENPLPTFSFIGNKKQHPKQIKCFITNTNKKTHKIIYKNIYSNPIYAGLIKNNGPRYCPSIEEKIFRFKNKNSHQIFLEPEGLNSNVVYPNGISMSLPFNIQIKIIKSIKGLENAHILRPGYSVEYDFFNPKDLNHTLESKLIKRLFFAGQINGTTGYEEAAAQGIIAGLNASCLCKNKEKWIPKRNEAYIGVLIDDLCTVGTKEPYRMFTSRAEHRLLLREDNADMRLTKIGRRLGIVSNERWTKFCIKKQQIKEEINRQRNIWINLKNPEIKKLNLILKKPLSKSINGEELLKRPEINYNKLIKLNHFKSNNINEKIGEQVEIQIKYKGYIINQNKDINKKKKYINIKLPKNINFNIIPNLSNEVISKLNIYKPSSIYRATCISGITPAAISILLIWLKKNNLLK